MYGTSAMQGWRVRMEDAHLAQVYIEPQDKLSLFAVFDGHVSQRMVTRFLSTTTDDADGIVCVVCMYIYYREDQK